ncbi:MULTISPECIES: hypothetical protein [Nocardiopsidaceae]|uniref:Uncharacterized protein n=2 Tax=Nocardiopsidaceae TaxID=83676 RepID=A0ABY6YGM3_9ACTN|nr:hypothetical protein [Streptomonospora nanhaiensis]WAE71409.1 hypothetical protein OUQ99_19465 [Streptomonospora nanhaiensis]
MRSVFVFPPGERSVTAALLDRSVPGQREPWILDGVLYIDIDDEETGFLFSDWDPEDVAGLATAVGHRPAWAVQIDVSGRVYGIAEVHRAVALLLANGGVTVDDHSAHPWTLREIVSGAVVEGRRFFRPRFTPPGWHGR